MQGLMLHCGSQHVTLDQLRQVPTPAPTASWRPVPHHQIAEHVLEEAEKHGCRIASQDYGLNPSCSKMFGVLRFHPEGHPEYTRALGFRNSHDKSLALGLAAGLNVFACDNLCFSGEIVIYRRHTVRIEIASLIGDAFSSLSVQYERLEQNVVRMKTMAVTTDEARLLIVRAAEMNAIPGSDILPVLNGFRHPPHPEFADPTRWNLYNSFTDQAKTYSPARADQCYRKLADIFGLN